MRRRRQRNRKAGQGLRRKKRSWSGQFNKESKVKRFYTCKITGFSAKSLGPIFECHISEEATVTIDEWKGYRPIAKSFRIIRIPSEFGLNFKAIHTVIYQVKLWITTTFSWVSKCNIERYLNEFSYSINTSQSKQTVFHNLIKRMVNENKLYILNIV
ncbi:transposase [Algoriphagus sp. 4150]|uniref:transposase n=1 Tax=Algoriphagus sp. 4150 TaxID=2817756 RepID=UPI0038D4D0D6